MGVTSFKPGDRVLISCITACGRCEYCRKGMYSHCTTGGWILGNRSTERRPNLFAFPMPTPASIRSRQGADEEALVMLSDILPTGFECGVSTAKSNQARPWRSSAPVRSDLAALLTAQFYSPAEIIVIDLDDNRLAVSRRFGATATINSSDGKAAEQVMRLTHGRGVDTAIEAVGIPATSICAKTSLLLAARSPISACMASRSIYILSGSGRRTSQLPRDWSTPCQRRCC